MLTRYRTGRLVAKIFIKLGWATLIATALLILLAALYFSLSRTISIEGLVPASMSGLLTMAGVTLAMVLSGHVALAIFDIADGLPQPELER